MLQEAAWIFETYYRTIDLTVDLIIILMVSNQFQPAFFHFPFWRPKCLR